MEDRPRTPTLDGLRTCLLTVDSYGDGPPVLVTALLMRIGSRLFVKGTTLFRSMDDLYGRE